MRGIGVAVFHVPLDFRITPAYAGNRQIAPVTNLQTAGLPLRMRGIEWSSLSCLLWARITPAYTGNRLYCSIVKSSRFARMFPKIH